MVNGSFSSTCSSSVSHRASTCRLFSCASWQISSSLLYRPPQMLREAMLIDVFVFVGPMPRLGLARASVGTLGLATDSVSKSLVASGCPSGCPVGLEIVGLVFGAVAEVLLFLPLCSGETGADAALKKSLCSAVCCALCYAPCCAFSCAPQMVPYA